MHKQSDYSREFYAISEVVVEFGTYLLGQKFVIMMDQNSLRSLTDKVLQTPEQKYWLPKLLVYDFTIEYKPGKDNETADSLSRSFFVA